MSNEWKSGVTLTWQGMLAQLDTPTRDGTPTIATPAADEEFARFPIPVYLADQQSRSLVGHVMRVWIAAGWLGGLGVIDAAAANVRRGERLPVGADLSNDGDGIEPRITRWQLTGVVIDRDGPERAFPDAQIIIGPPPPLDRPLKGVDPPLSNDTTAEQATMDVAELFRLFTNGDQTTWAEERAWIEENNPGHLNRLRASIAADGIMHPIRLCHKEMRVVDGHHRLIAAQDLGLARVPVADAWDGSDWPHMEAW